LFVSNARYSSILDLNKACIKSQTILLLGWTHEDIAKYIDTFKGFENKSPDLIREKIADDDYYQKVA
jgi:DNA excision repair protein ERCC-1